MTQILHVIFPEFCLVDKLKETRALTGFTRIFPETDQPLASSTISFMASTTTTG